MRDSFTKAYDAIFEIENHGDGLDEGSGYGGGYDFEQSAEYLNEHSQAIIRALTLVAEAEQLRKERDEWQIKYNALLRVFGTVSDELESKVNENGNA